MNTETDNTKPKLVFIMNDQTYVEFELIENSTNKFIFAVYPDYTKLKQLLHEIEDNRAMQDFYMSSQISKEQQSPKSMQNPNKNHHDLQKISTKCKKKTDTSLKELTLKDLNLDNSIVVMNNSSIHPITPLKSSRNSKRTSSHKLIMPHKMVPIIEECESLYLETSPDIKANKNFFSKLDTIKKYTLTDEIHPKSTHYIARKSSETSDLSSGQENVYDKKTSNLDCLTKIDIDSDSEKFSYIDVEVSIETDKKEQFSHSDTVIIDSDKNVRNAKLYNPITTISKQDELNDNNQIKNNDKNNNDNKKTEGINFCKQKYYSGVNIVNKNLKEKDNDHTVGPIQNELIDFGRQTVKSNNYIRNKSLSVYNTSFNRLEENAIPFPYVRKSIVDYLQKVQLNNNRISDLAFDNNNRTSIGVFDKMAFPNQNCPAFSLNSVFKNTAFSGTISNLQSDNNTTTRKKLSDFSDVSITSQQGPSNQIGQTQPRCSNSQEDPNILVNPFMLNQYLDYESIDKIYTYCLVENKTFRSRKSEMQVRSSQIKAKNSIMSLDYSMSAATVISSSTKMKANQHQRNNFHNRLSMNKLQTSNSLESLFSIYNSENLCISEESGDSVESEDDCTYENRFQPKKKIRTSKFCEQNLVCIDDNCPTSPTSNYNILDNDTAKLDNGGLDQSTAIFHQCYSSISNLFVIDDGMPDSQESTNFGCYLYLIQNSGKLLNFGLSCETNKLIKNLNENDYENQQEDAVLLISLCSEHECYFTTSLDNNGATVLKQWSTKTRNLLSTHKDFLSNNEEHITALKTSPDSLNLYLITNQGNLQEFSVPNRKFNDQSHILSESEILSACISTNNEFLFCGLSDGRLLQFSLSKKEIVKDYGKIHDHGITIIDKTSDGMFIFTGDNSSKQNQWCMLRNKMLMHYGELENISQIDSIAITPCSTFIYVGGQDDMVLRKWDVRERELIENLGEIEKQKSGYRMKISGDGKWLFICGGISGQVVQFDLENDVFFMTYDRVANGKIFGCDVV